MFNVRWVVLFGLLSIGFLSLAACGDAVNNSGGDSNPCGGCGCESVVDEATITEPDGWKANKGDLDDAALLAKGLELWKDESLSTNGKSCDSCHVNKTAAFAPSFATAYPHKINMASGKGVKREIKMSEIVQFCMVVPMAAKPLKWDDIKLAALTRAVEEKQKEYKKATEK